MAAGNRLADQMGRWQAGFFKTGDQPSADIAMRQHRVENRIQALLQLHIEVHGRKDLRVDVACRLVERDDPSTPYRKRGTPYRRHGVRLVMQNVTAERSVE